MLERLLANWRLKLLSLGLAFAIWVSISGENQIVQDFPVPLDVRLAEGRTLATAPPTAITVRLRGSESVIRSLDPLRMGVKLDLEDATPGEREVQLSRAHLSGVPDRVEVTFFPDRVRATVERGLRSELPVAPDLVGEPPEGHAFYGASVQPETVLVEGPESEIKSLRRLRTDPIRLSQRTRPFTERVGVVPQGSRVRVVDPQPVEVRVVVDAAASERVFRSVPVVLAGQIYDGTITPAALDVTLAAPPALLEQLRPNQVRAVADVAGLSPRPQPYRASVHVDFVDVSKEQLWRLSVKSVSRRSVEVRLTDRRLRQ